MQNEEPTQITESTSVRLDMLAEILTEAASELADAEAALAALPSHGDILAIVAEQPNALRVSIRLPGVSGHGMSQTISAPAPGKLYGLLAGALRTQLEERVATLSAKAEQMLAAAYQAAK